MFRGNSIQLARVFGIRIGVDFSWFLVLFLFIFLLSDRFQAVLGGSDTQAYIVAVVSALLFFVSLILHELGHALMAKRLGIGISGIDLWFFGGVAKMERDTDNPGDEFKIAIAGPVVTLLIVLICAGIGIALQGSERSLDAATLSSDIQLAPGEVLLGWLATINLVLLLFNLIPAFPLDGGRIARAAAWKLTGNRAKATRFSAWLGQGFAAILIGFGVFLIIDDLLNHTGTLFSGAWLGFLGFFLFKAARDATSHSNFAERIQDIRVIDVMDQHIVALDERQSIQSAYNDYFLRYGWSWFPVTDASGRLCGLIDRNKVDEHLRVSGPGEENRAVSSIMDLIGSDLVVHETSPIETVLGSRGFVQLGTLFAVDSEGVLRGMLSLDDLRRAIHAATADA